MCKEKPPGLAFIHQSEEGYAGWGASICEISKVLGTLNGYRDAGRMSPRGAQYRTSRCTDTLRVSLLQRLS
jgi:hypothetical protein